ncbi:hypothetical protein SM124_11620 [Bacillus sp. 31A1R]|uniref:VCBS repeat-containing protein n=1 Tax=Robertmurraya mangrovi TaxID=3098077 RepID=A0ABU5IZ53_9BACI|nr:hypothetical protein [Bacillus sp. 31A1R]MDZ5472396.1 hypothetical protein [Bacillus sp. 31A1R]
MKEIILFTILVSVILNLSSVPTHAEEKLNKDLMKMINEFLPPNSKLVSPEEPKSTKPYQFYDFNQDGLEEIIITFETKAKEQPNPSQYGVIVLRKQNKRWEKTWETQTQGVGLDYSGVADITGDGIKEYLFGVTIGASAGNNLEIFKWNHNSLKMIAEVPYHMMELLSNQRVGIAVWQRYIADTYFVDVLKWYGQKLVLDKDLYSSYYPVIEKFYNEKISKMNAWFYWYTLADAQIKANLFEKARDSIQKGTTLAKQLSLSDAVENFKKLSDQLEKQRVPFLEQLMTHSLKHYEVQNIKTENDSGQQRIFSINDGFQERVLRKVVHWLNISSQVNGTTEVSLEKPSNKLTLKTVNDEVITIEHAYKCVLENKRKTCTAKDGELIISENSHKVQIKSQSLYDWLVVGWRKELNGPTKEELLEEALFTRYLNYLGPSYDDFFMCPKIKIEPIDGDPRRHFIFASALNYAGHHGGDFDKLTFSVRDSNLTGLQVTNVKIDKHISQEETQKQCQKLD